MNKVRMKNGEIEVEIASECRPIEMLLDLAADYHVWQRGGKRPESRTP